MTFYHNQINLTSCCVLNISNNMRFTKTNDRIMTISLNEFWQVPIGCVCAQQQQMVVCIYPSISIHLEQATWLPVLLNYKETIQRDECERDGDRNKERETNLFKQCTHTHMHVLYLQVLNVSFWAALCHYFSFKWVLMFRIPWRCERSMLIPTQSFSLFRREKLFRSNISTAACLTERKDKVYHFWVCQK